MSKINHFQNINENSSLDKLIQFIPKDNLKNNQQNLIEKFKIKESTISQINSINLKKGNSEINKSSSLNKKYKGDIFFNDFTGRKSFTMNNGKKSNNSPRKKRRTLINQSEKNPLSMLNSLKKLNETVTVHGKNYFKFKLCKSILGFLSLFSIILALIDNEIYIKKTRKYLNDLLNEKIPQIKAIELLSNRKISSIENYLRFMNGIISLIISITVIIKYYFILIGEKLNKKLSEYDGFISAGYIKYIFLEFIVCLIFYPPFLNKIYYGTKITTVFAYSLNSIILPLNILKGYNFILLLMLQSRYNSNISKTICESYKVESDSKFIIRSEINSRMFRSTFGALFLFCCLLSALTRDFEVFSFDMYLELEGKKGINDLQNYMNNLWLSIISIVNVAFGDEYPRTNLGRFINFIICVIGILGFGMLIATINDKLEFNDNEKKAYLRLEKIFSPYNTQNKAADVIKTILLIAKNIKDKKIIKRSKYFREKTILILKIKAETKIFKNELLVSRVYSMPMNDLIKTMESRLYDNLLDFTNELDKINLIEKDFGIIQLNQKSICKKLEKITNLQNIISKVILDNHNSNCLNGIKSEISSNKEEKENKEIKEIKLNLNDDKIMKNKLYKNKSPDKIKKINYKFDSEKRKKKSPRKKNVEKKMSIKKTIFFSDSGIIKINRAQSFKSKTKIKLERLSPEQKNRKKKKDNAPKIVFSNVISNHKKIYSTNFGIKLTNLNMEQIKPKRQIFSNLESSLKKTKI